MNQYRCETCNYYEDDDNKAACNIREEWISIDVWSWIEVVGCASHSDFQSGLDKLEKWVRDNWMPLGDGEYVDGGLLDKIEELRQSKDGE